MIQWTDLNQLTPVTYDADSAPDGEKTVFHLRALTLRQRAELTMPLLENARRGQGHKLTIGIDLFSYLVAHIDQAGIAVDYEDRALDGRQVRCVARAWIAQHLPIEVFVNIFNKARQLQWGEPEGEGDVPAALRI